MSLSIQSREIKKEKINKQKQAEMKQELISKPFIDKNLISNNQTSIPLKPKKYPKSPYLQRNYKCANQEIYTVNFDNSKQQEISKEVALHPIKHKKGKSMDFQIQGLLSQEGYSNRINPINGRGNETVLIHMFFIDQFRTRNTISQMRNYRPAKKNIIVDQKKSNIANHKKQKSEINKNAKKQKKNIIQLSDNELQSHHLKKNQKSSGDVIKQSKALASTNSCSFPNRQSKSMELISHQRSKSSREKNLRNTPNMLKNLQISLPFPSKLNSLYSNTSSLFSSKKQFESYQYLNPKRIPTQSLQQFEQIRKYESSILIDGNECNKKSNESKSSLFEQLYENQLDAKPKTQQIITNYLNIFQKHQENQQQISIVIEQGDNLSFYNRFSHDFKQRKKQKLIKSYEFINQQQKTNQQNKLNEVIQIISETDTLGAQKKADLLKKIRQIIPIAKIGSKEIQNQLSPNISQQVRQSKCYTPNESLKSSLLQDEDLQLMNIKSIDQTLHQREIYLHERMRQQLQSLSKNIAMSPEQIQNQRVNIMKWINLQLKQIQNSRAQITKGLNFAKTILQKQKIDQLRQTEPIKCLSDKVLINKFNQRSPQKQIIIQKIKDKYQQKQVQQGKSEHILPKSLTEISDQFNSNDIKLEDVSEKKNATYTNLQLLKSIAIIDQRIQKNSTNIIKNHIFIDSGQKVEYDFDDDSPTSSKDFNKTKSLTKNLLCQISSEFIESQMIESQKEINIFDIQQLQQTPPTIQSRWLKLSPQQKQDIFEFILFDLSVQLYQDQRIPRHIFQSVHSFIERQKARKKKLLGFKTNTLAIKKYLQQLISYIINHAQQLIKIHSAMDCPLGPTNLQILHYMHPHQEKQEISVENQLQALSILDPTLFDRFQNFYLNSLQFEQVQENQIKEKKRVAFLKSATHIHNKAIFDCLNEQLDKIRPFGQWGEPFKWKAVAKFHRPQTFQQKNKIIDSTASNVSIFGQYMCGFIKDKQQCVFKDNTSITAVQIEAIRGQRLIRLLSDYLQDVQKKLVFIDDEETELMVSIDQFIFDELLEQLTTEIKF